MQVTGQGELREGETAVEPQNAGDAGLVFIGRIHTPWTSREMTPRQGRHDGPVCRLEIFEPWVPALKGVEFYSNLEVVYWLHRSRRDLVLQSPKNDGSTRGTFSLRSPVRPNPIAANSRRSRRRLVIARSSCDEAIQSVLAAFWIASRSLSSGGRSADPLARNDERVYSVPFSAAINLVALSSSTLASSLRLAGGSRAMPSWRGITCMCR
jgi:hypothetical protein